MRLFEKIAMARFCILAAPPLFIIAVDLAKSLVASLCPAFDDSDTAFKAVMTKIGGIRYLHSGVIPHPPIGLRRQPRSELSQARSTVGRRLSRRPANTRISHTCPMRRKRCPDCYARAATGHIAAAPPPSRNPFGRGRCAACRRFEFRTERLSSLAPFAT